jgi:predicted amidohydrolase
MSVPVPATRASVVQMTPHPGDIGGNMGRAERSIATAAADGSRLVVLPELFDTGYMLDDRLSRLATELSGQRVAKLQDLAGAHDVTIATAMALREDDGRLYDVGLVVTPDGALSTVRKRYLWGEESSFFGRGDPADGGLVVKTPVGLVGMVVCYEIGFPEVCRQLALAGAELLVVPSAFGRARLHAWQLLTRTRALENGVFLLAANTTGTNGEAEFAAHSTIVDPLGHRLGQLNRGDGVLTCEIDLAEIQSARLAIPYVADLMRDFETVAE